MDRQLKIGIIAIIVLAIIAIIIVYVQRRAPERPLAVDTAVCSEFSSVLEKLVADSLTSEYEPSTGEYEATSQNPAKTSQAATAASAKESTTRERETEQATSQIIITTSQIETTTEAYYEEVYRNPVPGDYIGTFTLTAYEWTGSPMANGEYPYYGACASNYFPLGTVLYIEGYGTFKVCDRGRMSDNVIDIYLGGVQECIEFGRRTAEVYYG